MRLKICNKCNQAKPSTEFIGLAGRACVDCKRKASELRASRKNVSLSLEEWDLILEYRANKLTARKA